MYDEPEVMKELHALRERLAEENQDLSPEELCAKLNERGRHLAKELGLKMSHPAKPRRRSE